MSSHSIIILLLITCMIQITSGGANNVYYVRENLGLTDLLNETFPLNTTILKLNGNHFTSVPGMACVLDLIFWDAVLLFSV